MKHFPWWGSVLMAIVVYCTLKYGVQELLTADHRLTGLLQLFAPLAAIAFLLLAGKQLYDADGKEEDGDSNSSANNDR